MGATVFPETKCSDRSKRVFFHVICWTSVTNPQLAECRKWWTEIWLFLCIYWETYLPLKKERGAEKKMSWFFLWHMYTATGSACYFTCKQFPLSFVYWWQKAFQPGTLALPRLQRRSGYKGKHHPGKMKWRRVRPIAVDLKGSLCARKKPRTHQ